LNTCCGIAAFLLSVLLSLAAPPRAPAQVQQPGARTKNVEDELPLTDDPSDPIGIDREPVAPPPAAVSGKPAGEKLARGNFGPEPPPFSARPGEVLTAVPSVHERAHRVQVELSAGLARVSSELEFENSGDKPAEVLYRLAVPEDAALASFQVCNARGCRTGLPDPSHTGRNAYDDTLQARGPHTGADALPAGDVHLQSDARGRSLLLRAAPSLKGQPLRIQLAYVANAPLHGGVVRFDLPARGMDPRAAPLELTLRASGFGELQANGMSIGDGPLQADPWAAVALSAAAANGGSHGELWKLDCGALGCARVYVSAPLETPTAADIVFAIDASPSTEGSARSRLLVTIAALLARAPAGSRVRALRFASQALPLVPQRKDPRELALSVFAPIGFEAELGAATRFESAWHLIESLGWKGSKARKLVVIVGDGGLTTGPARPFDAAKRAGVEVAVVNVSDRPTQPALQQAALLTQGANVEAGTEADAAVRGSTSDRLEERVAAVFQPVRATLRVSGLRPAAPLSTLRGGDSVTLEGRITNGFAVELGAHTLAARAAPRELLTAAAAHAAQTAGSRELSSGLVAVDRTDRAKTGDRPLAQQSSCDRRGPAQRQGGLSSDTAPVSLAQERSSCARTDNTGDAAKKPNDDAHAPGAGMPGSPLLSMLRQRILPAARGCFRKDRAGRADYQVRAVFEFELADREVVSARVQGKIAEALRSCLLTAVDSLSVPRFSGKVLVRYPLVTEREPLPAQVELSAEAAGDVDTVIAKP
jgi:hypothetical protein